MVFFQGRWGWAIGQKFEIFSMLIFGKINQQNVFDVILESQKAFLDNKKQKVEKVEKSGFFPRGLVHGFGKKIEFFSCFYCRLNRPGKHFCRYSRKEKGIFRL